MELAGAIATTLGTMTISPKLADKPSSTNHGSTFPHSHPFDVLSPDAIQACRYISQIIIGQAAVPKVPGIRWRTIHTIGRVQIFLCSWCDGVVAQSSRNECLAKGPSTQSSATTNGYRSIAGSTQETEKNEAARHQRKTQFQYHPSSYIQSLAYAKHRTENRL